MLSDVGALCRKIGRLMRGDAAPQILQTEKMAMILQGLQIATIPPAVRT